MNIVYEETKPLGLLGDFVECYWTMASARSLHIPVRNRILPDGCLDFIFVISGSLRLKQSAGAGRTLPRAFLVGPMNTSNFALLGGDVHIWGIRFKPGSHVGQEPGVQRLSKCAARHRGQPTRGWVVPAITMI